MTLAGSADRSCPPTARPVPPIQDDSAERPSPGDGAVVEDDYPVCANEFPEQSYVLTRIQSRNGLWVIEPTLNVSIPLRWPIVKVKFNPRAVDIRYMARKPAYFFGRYPPGQSGGIGLPFVLIKVIEVLRAIFLCTARRYRQDGQPHRHQGKNRGLHLPPLEYSYSKLGIWSAFSHAGGHFRGRPSRMYSPSGGEDTSALAAALPASPPVSPAPHLAVHLSPPPQVAHGRPSVVVFTLNGTQGQSLSLMEPSAVLVRQ